MKEYDIVIIGGGISGIYTMYNLIKKYPKLKVLLLEKNSRYGGRIYTYCEKVNGKDYCMDFGAGRLGFHHKLIMELLDNLKLNKKIIPIPNSKDYYEVKNNKGVNKTDYKNEIMNKLFEFINSGKIKNLSNSFLQKLTLNELLKKYNLSSFTKKVEDVFEYYQDLYHYNAYDVVNYFSNDYNNNSKYFTINGGLYSIIDTMIQYIKNKKCKSYKLSLNADVKNIYYDDNTNNYCIKYNKKNILAKYVICAIPRKDLVKFDLLNNFKSELNSIKDIDLLRIFEIYKKDKNGNVWFHDINKSVSNNELKFIIPINKDNGLIMSSYTEMHDSKYWVKLCNNNFKNFKDKLNNKLSITFNKDVPESTWLKMYYWDMGIGSWKKGVNSDYLSKKILNLLPNFFICGENYSKHQAWCEGSLDTSLKVINLIECDFKLRKNKSRKNKSRKNKIYV